MKDRQHDTESDPSLDDGPATDWTGEGGATTEGPATDPEDASAGEGEDRD